MKPALARWFKVSCTKTNLQDGCICTQKVLFSGGRSLFWRSKHKACPSSTPQAGGQPGSSGPGQASSHLAAWLLPPRSLRAAPCLQQHQRRCRAELPPAPLPAPALGSLRPPGLLDRVPVAAAPRRVQGHGDGCRMGACQGRAGPSAGGSTPASGLPLHQGGPGVLLRGTQGCSPPGSACFCSSSASPWHLPQHPEPNTTRARLLGCQRRLLLSASSPRKKTALLLHRSSWGTPPPSSSAAGPQATGPGLVHVWGWPSCSLAAPQALHSPSAAEAASRGSSWPRVQALRLAIAKGFAGTSLASPGGSCNSGAGVSGRRGMWDQPPPPLPAESVVPDPRVCRFSRGLCCLTWDGGPVHWVLQSALELSLPGRGSLAVCPWS